DGRLLPGSPCIDAGDSSALPPGPTPHPFGPPRTPDDPGMPHTAPPAPLDIGAAERQGAPPRYTNRHRPAPPPLPNVAASPRLPGRDGHRRHPPRLHRPPVGRPPERGRHGRAVGGGWGGPGRLRLRRLHPPVH